MSWGRIDDGLHDNDKWVELSLAARGLWTTAYSWTCRHRKATVTDGLLRMFAGGDPADLVNELVSVGMWHKPGHGCPRCPDIDRGYVFHDWSDYQERSLSEVRAAAGAKGGRAGRGEAKARRKQTSSTTPAAEAAGQPETQKPEAFSEGPDVARGKQEASKPQANAQAGIPARPEPEIPNPSSTDVDPLHGFKPFWDVWPKRGGRKVGKTKAQERWRKLPIEERRAAYRGARHYAAASAAGHQGAMDAWRWLRDRLWEDFQEPAQADPRGSPRDRPVTRLPDGSEIAL